MKKTKQTGSLYREGGFWYLRYYDDRVINGEVQRKRIAKRISTAAGVSKSRARELADETLADITKPELAPEAALTLVDFVEKVYLPRVGQRVRPSTIRGYHVIWDGQLKPHCEGIWLRDVRTRHAQDLLDNVAKPGHLNSNSMKHIKSFMSGVFRLALQLGYYAGQNPVRETSLPKVRPATETYAYSLEEIDRMLSVLPEPAGTVIAAAAYTGVRRGELRGLQWENYRNGEVLISRSVWKTHVTEPKSRKSRASIPVIKCLAQRLERHRVRLGNPAAGPIFPNGIGRPMDMNTLLTRVVLPVLNRCALCEKSKVEHENADHDYRRNDSLPKWRGWHAFRRGLATNLYRLGVPEKTIQAILRHANVSTTQTCYIKTVTDDAKAAMDKLESVLASDRPVNPAVEDLSAFDVSVTIQ